VWKKVFNWSEVHLSEVTSYIIHILVGKISTVFLQILEYLLTDQGLKSPEQG
jgi:hypothetical protein